MAEGLTTQDYEDVLTDKRRLVREIDVIMHGNGAAEQASLCDLIEPIRALVESKNEGLVVAITPSIEDQLIKMGWKSPKDRMTYNCDSDADCDWYAELHDKPESCPSCGGKDFRETPF